MNVLATDKIDKVGEDLKSFDFKDFLEKIKELVQFIDTENYLKFVFTEDEKLSVVRHKFLNEYIIYIPEKQIKDIFERSNKENEFILVRKLILHEMLHIKLGHLSNRYAKADPKILNLAGDIVINHLLDLRYPAIRANDFYYEEGLSTQEYINLLENDMKMNNSNSYKIQKVLSNSNEILHIEDDSASYNPEDVNGVNEQSLFGIKGGQKFSKDQYVKNEIPGFNNFKSILANSEGILRLSPSSYHQSYRKMNRRHNGDVILPGKISQSGHYENKFQDTAVLFVDVSGSMTPYQYRFAQTVSQLEKETGVMVVAYNHELIGEIDSTKEFFKATGGTNFQRAIGEFELLTNKKLKRFYVFTDGEDVTLQYAKREYPEMRVFKFGGKNIEELIKFTFR